VRGRLWKNTAEIRWEVSREREPFSESSVENLIGRLTQADSREVRRCAAESLGQLGKDAAPAIPALLVCAVDVDAIARESILSALEAIDPAWPRNAESRKAIPALVKALKSKSSDERKAAYRLVRLIGRPAVPELANELSDGDDTVEQVYVIRVLARMGPTAANAMPGLTLALGSEFLHVRIAAAEALANIGPPPETAIPALVAGLSDWSADARWAMATCLARVGTAAEPAAPFLLPLLADRDDRVREAAADALVQVGPKAAPALIELVQTRDARRLAAWIESMIQVSQRCTPPKHDIVIMEPREVWKNLSWTAHDIIEERARLEAAQEAALRVLGELGPAASMAVPAVTQALADRNSGIQLAAIQTLGNMGPEARSAISDLVQMLIHSNRSFREAAAEALEQIDQNWVSDPAVRSVMAVPVRQLSSAGRPGEIAVQTFTMIGAAAVPVLIDELSSGNRIARENAARALGRIGTGAQASIPALTGALQDNHPWVREQAASALTKIEDRIVEPPVGADEGHVNEQ
jgi:HEAT repeat protein